MFIHLNKIISVFLLFIVFTISSTSASGVEITPSKHARILINNVNIITMDGGGSFLKNHSILIDNGRIKEISPSPKTNAADVLIIDGYGRYLLPALIDAHVHVWDTPELAAYLAYGIGFIRNASGMPYHLSFKKDIEEGTLIGPRFMTTGPILNGQGPNTQINHQIVSNEQEARKAVQEQYKIGYRHLKVYSNLSLPVYTSILIEAKRLGMTIMGHTPEGIREEGIPYNKPFRIPLTSLLDDSYVSIEHMESIVWHGLSDELDEHKLRILARYISQSGTPVTPTLIAHHNLVKVAQTSGKYLNRDGVRMLNPFIVEAEQDSYKFWSNQPPNSRSDYNDFYQTATKIFQEEGVVLLAGTDSGIFTNIPGVSLIEELNLMVLGGLTPLEALKTATSNPSEVFGLGDELGRIKEGYLANLILVDKNPLKNISNLQLLSGMFIEGRWYDPEGILELKRQAENTSYEDSKRRIIEGLAAQGVSLDI